MIWWIMACISAFFVKGLCGFANTLVFTTILSFGNSNINISPVELLLGYPTNIILAWKERKSIKWKLSISLAAIVLLGSVPGIFFLKNTNTDLLKGLFGLLIIYIALEMLYREFRPKEQKQSKVVMIIIAVLSGILCGLYGVGALLGAYLSKTTEDSRAFKANICMIFVIENTFRIILYAIWGIITFDILKQALVVAPFMLVGLFAGMSSSRVLNEKAAKKLVLVMLMVSGAALVINSL